MHDLCDCVRDCVRDCVIVCDGPLASPRQAMPCSPALKFVPLARRRHKLPAIIKPCTMPLGRSSLTSTPRIPLWKTSTTRRLGRSPSFPRSRLRLRRVSKGTCGARGCCAGFAAMRRRECALRCDQPQLKRCWQLAAAHTAAGTTTPRTSQRRSTCR
jgi:hypothetical protein